LDLQGSEDHKLKIKDLLNINIGDSIEGTPNYWYNFHNLTPKEAEKIITDFFEFTDSPKIGDNDFIDTSYEVDYDCSYMLPEEDGAVIENDDENDGEDKK
jgi:hypothetical protein